MPLKKLGQILFIPERSLCSGIHSVEPVQKVLARFQRIILKVDLTFSQALTLLRSSITRRHHKQATDSFFVNCFRSAARVTLWRP